MTGVGEGLGARRTAGFKDFFQHAWATRVVAGRGLLSSTGFELGKEGAHRVWLVTDKVIRETGLIDRVEAGVADGGLEVAGVFDDVPQDSSTEIVDRCAAEARAAGVDAFLAVGGGSVLDTAKIADAVFTHGGTAAEQEGFFRMPRADDGSGAPLAIAPLVCVPTTAGTGSEVSMGAVVKDPARKVKLEICDFPLFPRLAILDPEATKTLPPKIAAATGIDALTHAIESYVSVEWNPFQEARSMQALRLIRDNLAAAVNDGPNDEEARGNMLVAASLAIAVELGSTHAMSHPCGGQYGVPHGVANAINLPHVIRFNAEAGDDVADRYRDVCEALGVEAGGSGAAVGDNLAGYVARLVEGLGLPTRLSQVGVPEEGIPALVEGAMGDALTLMNPRECSEEDYERLYRAAL
ncbi:MAG: iron-containing alcohol dehydrogenase [Actinomycetota bacterium]|nr:iron-containing alcohol dehydrogenase [Actinomycetota bacterium]